MSSKPDDALDYEHRRMPYQAIEDDESQQRLLDILFNDITAAPTQRSWLLLSDRLRLRDYLWEQGWRRDERPGDITDLPEVPRRVPAERSHAGCDCARRCNHLPDEVCERCSDG